VERSEIYYCSISVAELSFKRSLGKYSYQSDLAQRWQDTGINPLKFDDHAAHAFGRFSPEWVADPFDRQIMAVAASNDLVLVTSDRRMLAQGFDWVLDATT
jgi:PIN domain nuclease of toxin-antitoxin system